MIDFIQFKKKQKTLLFISIFIITIVLFFGCLSFQNDAELISKAVVEKNPSFCSTFTTGSSVDSCYSQVFKVTKNELTVEKCNEFGLKWKDSCFDIIGRTQLNSKYCNEIKNPSLQIKCKDFVTIQTRENTVIEPKTEKKEPVIIIEPKTKNSTIINKEPVLLTASEVEKIVIEKLHFDAVSSITDSSYQGKPIFKIMAYKYTELNDTTATLFTIKLHIDAKTGEKIGTTQTITEKTIAFNKSNAILKAKITEKIDTILKALYTVQPNGQVNYLINGNRTIWETNKKYHIETLEIIYGDKGQLIKSKITKITKTKISKLPFTLD